MHALAIVILSLLGLVAALLLWPLRLRARAQFALPEGGEGALEIWFFSGLVKWTLRYELHAFRAPEFSLFRVKRKRRVLLWTLGQPKKQKEKKPFPFRELWAHVRVKSVKLDGALGISEDAFATAMLAGAVSIAVNGVLAALLYEKHACVQASVLPDFQQTCLRLNLESIAECMPIHIITAYLLNAGTARRVSRRVLNRMLSVEK